MKKTQFKIVTFVPDGITIPVRGTDLRTAEEAERFMTALSGRGYEVISMTGVAEPEILPRIVVLMAKKPVDLVS